STGHPRYQHSTRRRQRQMCKSHRAGGARAGGGERDAGAGGPQAKARRPRPVINRDNAGFWEGVAEHRLLIQRCGDCSALRLPWLPGCAECGSGDWDTVEASGAGTVFSYVVMHHPPFPAFDPPYAVGLIELAEGVRMVSNVVGVPYDKVRIGMPVRLEFLRVDEELELPVFRAGEED
ncbi:Zn-ribbon domain-containing OB-fold protein, partial [Streptomyces venezuelae]|uniref:Zn-ribbon domain-containing OB-fold protein n=1 Tax=Streptomyces venezuelae TaxID=54571 RepID=UPI00351B8032